MELLAGKNYDPGTAVAKATSALLAMTAFDTTNLRLAITVPAHGMILVKMRTALVGANTFPQVMLGAMNGSTILGRQVPQSVIGGTALATTRVSLVAEFMCTGLTPGAMNVDAAYGVEFIVAATNIQYGGPNNTTASDAWGGFDFQIWDPDPNPTNFGLLSIDADGRVDVIKVAGTTQTAKNIGGAVPAAAAGASGGLLISGSNAGTTTFAALTVTGTATFGALTVSGVTTLTGGMTANITGNLIGTVSTLTTYTGDTPQTGDAYARIGAAGASLTALGDTRIANLDATISSRMASYTQPTGFLASDFPATVASPTNITAGTITTVTNLTNAPTAGDLTATMKASVTTAATAATPIAASVTAPVDISAAAVQAIWDALTAAFTTANSIGKKLADWVIGTAQTGDSFARIGANGAGLTALGDTRIANLDAAVTSRLASADYTAPANSDVAAIKTKTDSLVFTVANELNTNVQSVNNVTVNGIGTTGSPWGP